MMGTVLRWVLQFRFLVLAVAVGILGFGFTSLPGMAVDAFPEFAPPQVEIQTEALGLSAAEVEQLITSPMEADLLNGVAWVEAIHSKSVPACHQSRWCSSRGPTFSGPASLCLSV
ncbi:protein HelA [Arthrobacter sp. Hiyo8]|nr:protein HelA [Arthrobacter sp. Hiyo8]